MKMHGIPSEYRGKPRTAVWCYRGSDNNVVGYVARYDGAGTNKECVPFFRRVNGTAWGAGAAPEPRPLFSLDVLAKGDLNDAVFVVEGEKCAAALHSLGMVAVTSSGGSKAALRTDWHPLSRRRVVYVLPDNDDAGRAYARDVCAGLAALPAAPRVYVAELPGLTKGGDVVDWIALRVPGWDEYSPVPEAERVGLANELAEVVQRHAVAAGDDACPEATIDGLWLDPVPLETMVLPSWPGGIFPEPVERFVEALAVSTETPRELASMTVLAALATAAQGKYRVRVKTDYFEPLALWSAVAMAPGSRKSAVLNQAVAPLTDWERHKRDQLETACIQAKADVELHNEHVLHLRKVAAKAKGLEREELLQQIHDAESKAPTVPALPQIWTSDVTPENLATIMAANDERMAILSDEGGVFETMAGRYSGGIPNLDIYLQGHAGSPVRVNRGSRPPVFLNSPTLSLGLTPQPDVLRGLTKNPELRGRGLLARFLYALPPSNLGYRTGLAPPVPLDVRAAYAAIVNAMLEHPWAVDDSGERTAHVLLLSHEAQEAYGVSAQAVETQLREGGLYSSLTDWAGKLPGTLVRIAGVLHVARYASGRPECARIGAQDLGAAIRLADVLGAHALAAFDLMGADPALDGARAVLRWLRREGRASFTFRDCHAAHKARFKRAADLEPCIEVLSERHYIREQERKLQSRGRPSRIFDVSPVAMGRAVGWP